MSALPTLALSLIQPWAWAVIHGPKDIENRTWWSTIRGPIWIASSSQVTRRYYEEARDIIQSIAPDVTVPALDDLEYGKILGRATITDCILPGGFRSGNLNDCRTARTAMKLHGVNWGRDYKPPLERRHHRWHFADQYGYVLADRAPVAQPVPCRGHQRWWKVPPAVLEQLRSAA